MEPGQQQPVDVSAMLQGQSAILQGMQAQLHLLFEEYKQVQTHVLTSQNSHTGALQSLATAVEAQARLQHEDLTVRKFKDKSNPRS